MRSYPPERQRQSIRLRGYDYRRAGMYFVTICTHMRRCLLGDVVEGEMRLNEAGRLVLESLRNLTDRFPGLRIDSEVVMPNHVHAIFLLSEIKSGEEVVRAPRLGEVVRAWKATSARCIRPRSDPSFGWQRNYYERIIRNEEECHRIRQYIVENPLRWEEDENHPDRLVVSDAQASV